MCLFWHPLGDDDLLASLYIMSASALGINNVLVLAPTLNAILVETAKKLNPRFIMTHVEGFYTHPVIDEIFKECNLVVDLSHYGLANKLLLEKGYRENIPIIRGLCYEQDSEQGFKTFTYMRGREWQELEQIISPNNLPNGHFDDGVMDTIIAGIVLEETKKKTTKHIKPSEKDTGRRLRSAGYFRRTGTCLFTISADYFHGSGRR